MSKQTSKGNTANYHGMFGNLYKIRNESKSSIGFTRRLLKAIVGSFAFVVFVAILSAFPIIMIIIGGIYIGSCDAQKYIPVWLLIYGCFALISIILSLVIKIYKTFKRRIDDEFKLSPKLEAKYIIDVFLFAWLVAGSVWVFNVPKVVYNNASDPYYCHQVCYQFAFTMAIFSWVIIGIAFFGALCCLPLFFFVRTYSDQ